MSLTAGEIVRLLKSDRDALRELAVAVASEMGTNFRWTVGLIVAIWATSVIPLLMRMAGVV